MTYEIELAIKRHKELGKKEYEDEKYANGLWDYAGWLADEVEDIHGEELQERLYTLLTERA